MSDDWETGRRLFREERYEEAIPHLERAAREESASDGENGNGGVRGLALNHLGMAQYGLGRYEDAVETFEAAIAQSPGKARLHYNLGNSLLALYRSAEAKGQYETALEIDPDYDEARDALVVVAADLARPTPPPRPARSEPIRAAPPPVLSPSGTAPPADRASQAPLPSRLAETPAPPGTASPSSSSTSDLAETLQQIAALENRLVVTRDSILETRRLLARQEDTENELVTQLLDTIKELAAQQDAALREAALKQAQALLSAAASRLGNEPGL